MRKLLFIFAAAVTALAQTPPPVHVYDAAVPYPFGAPLGLANCSGNASGQSNQAAPIGASEVLPISQPITITRGVLDQWMAPNVNGTSYSVSLTCTNATQRWPVPQLTWVVPSAATNTLAISGATTPVVSGNTWVTILTVSSGDLSPWAAGQNAYVTAPSNSQYTGGYLVTSTGAGTITVAAATSPPSSGSPAPLVPIPTTPWAGIGSMVGAGPFNLQAITSNVVPTPNTLFSLSQISPSGCSNGQLPVYNGSNWICGTALIDPLTLQGGLIIGGDGGALIQLPPGAPGDILTIVTGSPAWLPLVIGGDLFGLPGSAVVVGIQDRPVLSTAPATGQSLGWNGSAWAPTTVLLPANNLSDVSDAATALSNLGGAGAGTCPSNQYVNGLSTSPACAQVQFSQLAGTITYAQSGATSADVPNSIAGRDASGNSSFGTVTASLAGNAATASGALNTPTLCADGQAAAGVDQFFNATGCIAITTSITQGTNIVVTPSGGGYQVSTVANPTFGGGVTANLTGNVTGNVSGSAATVTSSFGGQVSGTQSALTVLEINGTTFPVDSIPDAVFQIGATPGTGQIAAIPDCEDTAGQHLNRSTSTHLWSCGTSGGTAGSVSFPGVGSGTNSNSLLVAGSLAPTGPGTISANQLNGASLGGLSTGPLCNMTTTGVPYPCVAGDIEGALGFTPPSVTGAGASGSWSINAATASAVGFAGVSGGTNTATLLTSGSLKTTGAGVISANQINSTALSGLAAGPLCNTASNGVPYHCAASDLLTDLGTIPNASLTNSGALTVTANTGLSGGGSVAPGGAISLSIATQTDPSWLTLTVGGGRLTGGSLASGLLKNNTGSALPTIANGCSDYINPACLNGGTLPASVSSLTSAGNVNSTAGSVNSAGSVTAYAYGTTMASATYVSGVTVSGSSPWTCTFSFAGGAVGALTYSGSSGALPSGALTLSNQGSGYTSNPTTAAVSGTGCSGSSPVLTTLLTPGLLSADDGLGNVYAISAPASGVGASWTWPTPASTASAVVARSASGSFSAAQGVYGTVGQSPATPSQLALAVFGGSLDVADIGSLGSTALTNGSFTYPYTSSWAIAGTAAGNCSLTGTSGSPPGTLACSYASAGSTVATQLQAQLALPLIGGAWYAITYTITGVTGSSGVAITSAACSFGCQLVIANGTQTTYMRTLASPSNFTISMTLTAGQAFTMDNISAQLVTGGNITLSGFANFGAANETRPNIVVSALPATCGVGDTAYLTTATAGQNIYACTAANTWTQQGGSGGGLTPIANANFVANVSGSGPSVPTATALPTTNNALVKTTSTNGALGASGLLESGSALSTTDSLTAGSYASGTGAAGCGVINGCIALSQGSSAGTPTAGNSYLRADSTSGRLLMDNGTTGEVQVVGSGADINSSDQVTITHLTTALPRSQGGLNSGTAGTGLLRDGTTPTASELSGACATSGSNVVTCAPKAGGAVGGFASILSTVTISTTTETNILSATVPGTIQNGTMFEFKFAGVSTSGAGATTSQWNVYYGTAGNDTDPLIGSLTSTPATTGTNNPLMGDILIAFRSPTSVVVAGALLNNTTVGLSNSPVRSSNSGVITVSGTTGQKLTLTWVSGNAALSASFNVCELSVVQP